MRPLPNHLLWALALTAGALNGVAFIWWGAAALIANVPLLLALANARTAARAAALGALVGILGGVHIYGIVDYGWFLFFGFSFYTGSQMVIYGVVWRRLDGRVGPYFDLVLPALIWTLTEWVRTIGPLAMPASYVGCIADIGWLRGLLALAPVVGGLGVSFVVALIQSVLFHGLFRRRSHGRPTAVFALVASLCVGYGFVFPPDLGPIERTIKVAAVQGGLANTQYAAATADASAMRDVVQTYRTLTQQAYAAGADLVVWPETAVRAPVLRTPALAAQLFPPKGSKSTLVAGLLHTDRADGIFNLAVTVTADGVQDRYAKVRLVPYAEGYMTPGDAWRPLESPHGKIGALICLESVYPEAARTLTRNGAEVLVVMSNDAGFGVSPISHHMTNRAIVRAVENGRWLVRVGQAGITTIIDPTGQRAQSLPMFTPAVLTQEIRPIQRLTLFTRWGNWWMWVVGLVLLLGGLKARFYPAELPPEA